MSFTTDLIDKCNEYTNMVIGGTKINLPYKLGAKNTPSKIILNLINSGKSGSALQTWATNNPDKTAVDCSGIVYYALNEATGRAVRRYFEAKFPGTSLTYAYGISAANLTSTSYGYKLSRAADMTPGCTIRFDNGGHVLVITDVIKGSDGVVKQINYSHSNGSKGPHTGYITISNQSSDLGSSSQKWVDKAYTDSQAKNYYNHTIRLNFL